MSDDSFATLGLVSIVGVVGIVGLLTLLQQGGTTQVVPVSTATQPSTESPTTVKVSDIPQDIMDKCGQDKSCIRKELNKKGKLAGQASSGSQNFVGKAADTDTAFFNIDNDNSNEIVVTQYGEFCTMSDDHYVCSEWN